MKDGLWKAKGSDVSEREYEIIKAEERLVYDVQKSVKRLLKGKGLKASDLAALLNVSEARVSQMLSAEGANLTLRTVARIFHQLGVSCAFQCEADKSDAVAQAPVKPKRYNADEVRIAVGLSHTSASGPAAVWLTNQRSSYEAMTLHLADYGERHVWSMFDSYEVANENKPGSRIAQETGRARQWQMPRTDPEALAEIFHA